MSKTPSKLGRGLSALMAEVAVPPADNAAKTPAKKTKASGKKSSGKAGAKKAGKPQTGGTKTGAKKAGATKTGTRAGVSTLPIDKIDRNPNQPRRNFEAGPLEDLARSIADKGVLQPILVRPLPQNDAGKKGEYYQIVAGERRWQASLKAGITHMPALVRELSDQEVLEIGVVENVQREDLNPIEEALAYQALKDQFGRRQEDIASAIGKSRSHVANCLRLLSLPEQARTYLIEGKISAGHARAILSAPDPMMLAEVIVQTGLSVRDAENWARNSVKDAPIKKTNTGQGGQEPDANTRHLEQELADYLGLKVSLNHKNPGGKMSITYKTLEQLDDLVKRLRKG